MDTTRKKEERTAKDDVAPNSDGRAERDGAVVGRSSGLSQGQDLVAEDCCGLMSHWGRRGLSKSKSHLHLCLCYIEEAHVIVTYFKMADMNVG